MNAPPGTIPGLDVLRGLAIMLVVSLHVAGDYAAEHGHFPLERFPLFHFGWTGVDLFFVLSGYLIGGQIWRELLRTSTIDVPTFLVRRGLRIWPLYFFFIGMLFVLHPDLPIARAFPDLFFYSNYRHGRLSGGWSLSVEEQFYVFAPLLLLCTRGLTFGRKWTVLAALFVLLPCIRAWLFHGRSVTVADVAPGVDGLVTQHFHTRSDGLVCGLFLAWLSVARAEFLAPRGFARNWLVPLALVLAGAALRRIDKDTFAFTGLALIYGGLTLFMLRDQSWISRISRWRGFHVLSKLSYGMYLNHPFLLPWVIARAGHTGGGFDGVHFAGVYAATTLASIAAAAITYCVVEHPFLALRERWLAGRRARAPVA